MSSTNINILPSHNIDRSKWDQCILYGPNTLIYAHSSYLDSMSDNWSGIIINDYETVMPICWRKKFGIRYTYDVPFIQQLGWFSKTDFKEQDLLIKTLFSFCRYGDYNFNYHNNSNHTSIQSNNFVLSLSQGYDNIKKNYSTDLINNLKKALRENLIYENETTEIAISLYKSLYKSRFKHVTDITFANFSNIVKHLEHSHNSFARKITNSKKELLAVALLLKDKTRIYNVMNSTPEAGRKSSANHLLFDNIFLEFSGSPLIFDFEGSDIPGIASFYKNFGAIDQPYSKIHFNHLPFPLGLLKR